MSILVFANGELENGPWLRPLLAAATAVIAADGGARHALAAGRRPDVLIGDFDSFDVAQCETEAELRPAVIRHPADKDATDLELALLLAAGRWDEEIVVVGWGGGRLDQALANVMLLAHPKLCGRRVVLAERGQRAWLVVDATNIRGRPGDILSLIPVGGPARVAATSGLRWPLRDEVLHLGASRGISNELAAWEAAVEVSAGMLLCVHLWSEP
jgi:thiamine pyrophosphokinase